MTEPVPVRLRAAGSFPLAVLTAYDPPVVADGRLPRGDLRRRDARASATPGVAYRRLAHQRPEGPTPRAGVRGGVRRGGRRPGEPVPGGHGGGDQRRPAR